MRFQILPLCFILMLAACGSDKNSATGASADTQEGTVAPSANMSQTAIGSSKMAQQATTSSQSQADQSETASSGSSDDSGTNKLLERRQRGGTLGIHADGGINFDMPPSQDFNVALNFQGYVGPDAATADGNVRVRVRHGSADAGISILLEGTTDHTYSNGREIHESTEPNILITKKGSRTAGKVIRQLTGFVRRALASSANPNADFDFLINHQNSIVTDTYAAGSLTSRGLSGTVVVKDNSDNSTATFTFNDVVRPSPQTCLCPTKGSIVAVHTKGTQTSTITHAFTGKCGEVNVSEKLTIAASKADATTTPTSQSTSTASSDIAVSGEATTTATITWDFCIPS